jgi:hypothetical protein
MEVEETAGEFDVISMSGFAGFVLSLPSLLSFLLPSLHRSPGTRHWLAPKIDDICLQDLYLRRRNP